MDDGAALVAEFCVNSNDKDKRSFNGEISNRVSYGCGSLSPWGYIYSTLPVLRRGADWLDAQGREVHERHAYGIALTDSAKEKFSLCLDTRESQQHCIYINQNSQNLK